MSSESENGCPAPKPITLVQRLAPVKGSVVTVFTPGFPDLTKTEGILTANTPQSFTVGRTQVFFATSFYVVLNTVPKRSQPFTVNGTAEELGGIGGRLVQVGRNFVEFIQPGSRTSTLFPLNLFTEIHCERDHDE